MMRKLKLKMTVKMRKMDSGKENNDVDYNDDKYEDIGKVRELKIGQEDGENEDWWGRWNSEVVICELGISPTIVDAPTTATVLLAAVGGTGIAGSTPSSPHFRHLSHDRYHCHYPNSTHLHHSRLHRYSIFPSFQDNPVKSRWTPSSRGRHRKQSP